LEVLVEGEGTTDRDFRGAFEELSERPSPLRNIDPTFLLDWAYEKPNTRFIQLSKVIMPWKEADQVGSAAGAARPLEWTQAALRMVHESPEPTSVLQNFYYRFFPSGWS